MNELTMDKREEIKRTHTERSTLTMLVDALDAKDAENVALKDRVTALEAVAEAARRMYWVRMVNCGRDEADGERISTQANCEQMLGQALAKAGEIYPDPFEDLNRRMSESGYALPEGGGHGNQ